MPAPPEHGRRVSARARLLHRAVEECAHAGIGFEVAIDHLLGFLEADTQVLSQAESLLTVHDAEVDGLRAAAHGRRDLFERHAEDARGGRGVEVGAGAEGMHEVLVSRQVREKPKLDLGIIRRHEEIACAQGHEAPSDAAAELGAHGNVLQIRIG